MVFQQVFLLVLRWLVVVHAVEQRFAEQVWGWRESYRGYRWYVVAYLFFVFGQYADYLSTYWGLSRFPHVFYETNPVMDVFISTFGFAAHGVLKVVVIPVVLLVFLEMLLARSGKQRDNIRVLAQLLVVFGMFTLVVAVKNFYIVLQEVSWM